MFCRNCGRELSPDARYCNGCGSATGSLSVPNGASRRGEGPGMLKVLTVIVSVFIIFAALAIFIPEESEPSLTQGNVTITGGLVSVDVDISGDGIIYTGSGEASWMYLDTSSPYLEPIDSDYSVRGHVLVEGTALSVPGPGIYDVFLVVDGDDRHHGTMVLDGSISRTYEWKAAMGGEERLFSVDLTYTLSEYRECSESDTPRRASSMQSDSRFVVTDGPVYRLSSALADEYRSAFGEDVSLTDQQYADFLLSFVQCAIGYPDTVSYSSGRYVFDEGGSGDLYLYGQTEYWAYPIETLHRSSGDCEDTSFLLCSLLSVSGYDSALVLMPSHMMAAVELESFEPIATHGLEITYKRVVGHEYNIYFCETTYSRFIPVGYMAPALHDEVMDEVEEVTFVKSTSREAVI